MWYIFLEECALSNGEVKTLQGGEYVDDTNSAKECAILVEAERSDAIGMNWYSDGSNQCYAVLGLPFSANIEEKDGYIGCLF